MARSSDSGLTGLLLIDKPPGWTSHDVVAKCRGITRQRRIGHTGTLDPMATGLLVLCLGRATRLVEYMVGHDKRYVGEIQLGITTDTDDAQGTVTGTAPVPELLPEVLTKLGERFTGEIQQRPPAYSAVKVEGKRAYAVARKGGEVKLLPRPVTIHSLRLAVVDGERLSVSVHCGSGTYIRSLARDIGTTLGCGAHLSALRRVAAGGFAIDDAVTLEGIAEAVSRGDLEELLLSPDDGLTDMDAAIVEAGRAAQLARGGVLESTVEHFRESAAARIYEGDGGFVGVGAVGANGQIRGLKVFATPNSD